MKRSRKVIQTHEIAESLLQKILETSSETAVVVALEGDLGGGKTTFTQGFAKALGVEEKVTSPTFVILKNYKVENERFKKLIHIDAYRLQEPEDILELGWKELVKDPQNIILVEWAEKIKKILPEEYYLVKFKHISEKERGIDISLKINKLD